MNLHPEMLVRLYVASWSVAFVVALLSVLITDRGSS
jgi:hypothetical protein